MPLILEDSSSAFWSVTVNDLGVLAPASVASGSPSTIYLNDPSEGTSWLLGISTLGVLNATPESLGAYPTFFNLSSTTGLSSWNIGINSNGDLNTSLSNSSAFGDDSFGIMCPSGFDQTVTVF